MIKSAAAIVLVAAAAYLFKVPTLLGTHPFWATQVLLVGAAIGFILSIAPLLPRIPKIAGLIVLTLVCFATASYGKSGFAASYAEDAFAGQLWYFGSFGASAFFFGVIGSLLKK